MKVKLLLVALLSCIATSSSAQGQLGASLDGSEVSESEAMIDAIEANDRLVASQPVDSDFQLVAELIAELFAQAEASSTESGIPDSVELMSIDCRTSVCRVELAIVSFPPRQAGFFIHPLLDRLSVEAPEFFFGNFEGITDADAGVMVFYLWIEDPDRADQPPSP